MDSEISNRQLKLTSFFKRFVFNAKNKSRYINLLKLKQKSTFAAKKKNQVSQLCERFTEMNMEQDFNGISNGIEVVNYLKTQVFKQMVIFDSREQITDSLLNRLNALQGKQCFFLMQAGACNTDVDLRNYITIGCNICRLRLIFEKDQDKGNYSLLKNSC